jgi:hypothetical protein
MVDRSASGADYKPPAEGWKQVVPPPTPKGDLPAWLMDKAVQRWLVQVLERTIHVLIGWRDWLVKVNDAPEEPPAPTGQEPFLLEEIEEEDPKP